MTLTTVLMLATWCILVSAMAGLGLLVPSRLVGSGGMRSRLLAGSWLATSGFVLIACFTSFFLPLASGPVGLILGVLVIAGLVSAFWALWTHRASLHTLVSLTFTIRRWSVLTYFCLLAIGLALVSRFAVAEPTDADFGLYRMNQVLYAEQFRIIPGLANLHDRFGFNSSTIPTAAILSHGIWSGLGYRVVTGFFLTMLVWTVTIRILVPRKGGATPGDWVTVIGAAFIAGVAIRDTGRWIASPGQDLIFAVVAIVSLGLLADTAFSSERWRWSGSAAVVTAALCGTARPIGWVLWLTTAIVVGYLGTRRTSPDHARIKIPSSHALAAGISIALLAVMLARDAVTSGWLLFPLSKFPLPVAWIAPDPSGTALAITEYARAPLGTDQDLVAREGWLRAWLPNFVNSWEVRSLAILAAACLLTLLWASGRRAWRQCARQMAVAALPSVAMSCFWFASAPDLRFGWAGLVGLVAIPLAFLVAGGAYDQTQFKAVGITALVMSVLSVANAGLLSPRGRLPEPRLAFLGPVILNLEVAGPRRSDPSPGRLGDGTPIIYSAQGDNWCAELFPLCLMNGTGHTTRSLGDSVQDGFAQLKSP